MKISPWTLSFRDRAFEAQFQNSWLKATSKVNRAWVAGGRAALWVAHDPGLAQRLGARTVAFP